MKYDKIWLQKERTEAGSRLNIKVNKKLSVFSGRGSRRHVIFDYHARANIQLWTFALLLKESSTCKNKNEFMIPVLLITFSIILIKKETSSWLKRNLPWLLQNKLTSLHKHQIKKCHARSCLRHFFHGIYKTNFAWNITYIMKIWFIGGMIVF